MKNHQSFMQSFVNLKKAFFLATVFFSLSFSTHSPFEYTSQTLSAYKTHFGDIDGDGLEDIIQFSRNKIFAMKNNFERHGILNKYLNSNIKRLVLGDFTTAGREHGRVQLVCIMKDNSIRVYSSSDDNRSLWYWFSQANFIGDGEEALVGDFDGNGADDILVYNPFYGTLKLYARNAKNSVSFRQITKFKLGNLSNFDLKNKKIYVGEFGQDIGQADLLIEDPNTSQISRYDSVLDDTGAVTFWWAFTTKKGFLQSYDIINVGNIEGGERDDILISSGNNYNFYKAEFDNGVLKRINDISMGNLSEQSNVRPVMGHFAGFDNESGVKRDDIILYNKRQNKYVQMDARFDRRTNQFTYWRAYTNNFPTYNEGWSEPRTDKWLIVKCRLSDGPNTTPQSQEYFENLFTKKGLGKWGMYDYLHNLSYGSVILDAELSLGWKTITQNSNHTKGNGFQFKLWSPIQENQKEYYNFIIEKQNEEEVYLKHVETDKYLSSSKNANGALFWTWAPIPSGHENYYTFKMIDLGNDEYYFKHKYSGKYLVSASKENDGTFFMWGPIPNGDEPRYTFQVIDNGRNSNGENLVSLKHKYSGKFITKTKDGGRGSLGKWCAETHAYSDLEAYKGVLSIYNKGDIDYGRSNKNVVLHMDDWDQNLIAHEMMHVYGLSHSYDDQDQAYNDPYDIEGSVPEDVGRFVGDFGSSGAGLHALNKQKLGWLPAQRIRTLPFNFSSPTEIQLAALNRPECNGALLLIIKLSEEEEIGVELRENRDWDQGFGETAVYIRNHDKHTHPDHFQKISYLQTMGDGPQFIAGEEFKGSGISIKIKEIDARNGVAKLDIVRL